MYKLDVTDSAEQDLEHIIAYISEKLDAPVAASDFIDAVLNVMIIWRIILFYTNSVATKN